MKMSDPWRVPFHTMKTLFFLLLATLANSDQFIVQPGKTYLTRDGRRAKVADVRYYNEFPLSGSVETKWLDPLGVTWNLKGKVLDSGEHHADLVAEIYE